MKTKDFGLEILSNFGRRWSWARGRWRILLGHELKNLESKTEMGKPLKELRNMSRIHTHELRQRI